MDLYSKEYRAGSHIVTAATTVLLYDFLLTIDDEINYVWLQTWTKGTFFFCLNRYLPFVDTLMALFLYRSVTDPQMCQSFYESTTWVIAAGLIVSEVILLLRTWAMWERKRSILILLSTTLFLSVGPGIVVTVLEAKSWRFTQVPLGGQGCNLQSASKLIALSYSLIAFSETVVVTLTMMKGFEHLRTAQSSWVKHVYRHGLLFYVYLLVITVINIVVPLAAPQPAYKLYMAVTQRVIHSIFCNRVILLIMRQRPSHFAERSFTVPRSLTKSRSTGNLETMFSPGYTDQLDVQSDARQLDEQLDEYDTTIRRQDWTHY